LKLFSNFEFIYSFSKCAVEQSKIILADRVLDLDGFDAGYRFLLMTTVSAGHPNVPIAVRAAIAPQAALCRCYPR
jgi:hypothetical protein